MSLLPIRLRARHSVLESFRLEKGAVLTVISQAVKAAVANPVKALKFE